MNPPDYYPVPSSVLKAMEQALKKYIESKDADPQLQEVFISMLMGEEWVLFSKLPLNGLDKNNNCLKRALDNVLPCWTENEKRKPVKEHEEYMVRALVLFKQYLNDPS